MRIQPKRTPTLAVRPGPEADLLTRTLSSAEAILRAGSFEDLLEISLDLLFSRFGVPALALIKNGESGLRLQTRRWDPKNRIDAPLLQAAVTSVKAAMGDEKNEMADGIQRLTLDDRALNFALLSAPGLGEEPESCLLFWLDPEDQAEPVDASVDFLIRQLQSGCQWYARISESQNLLHIDDLTGLHNQRYLDLVLEREIKRSQRYGSPFSLLFIDLDHFKPINDTFGHQAGSQVLREIAALIKATVRDVDLVFRFGGDEFVVVLIEAEGKTGQRSAKRIKERIEATRFVVAKDSVARVTSSIGVASYPEHASTKERLIALADECMYESKRRGKNQVVLAPSPTEANPSRSEKDAKSWPAR